MADADDRRIHNRPIYPSAVPGANSGGSGRSRSPVEQWFEVFVYAPLGFALDARQLFPRFVDRGRNQVVLARVIGKYAVEHGSKQVEGYLEQSQTQVAAVLQALGVLPEDTTPASSDQVDAFEADAVVFTSARADESADESADEAPADGPVEPSDEDLVQDPAPAADELAIPDYDNLSASQVIPRLGGLATDELEAVRRYEAAERGRKTILGKIAQLQSA
jgi:hypothetical protein